jgi:hypothetical protein
LAFAIFLKKRNEDLNFCSFSAFLPIGGGRVVSSCLFYFFLRKMSRKKKKKGVEKSKKNENLTKKGKGFIFWVIFLLWLRVDERKNIKRQRYLEELESGKHHEGLSENAGKQEKNRVFMNSARAAGFSESVAKNHLAKIDRKIGLGAVERAFFIGKNRPSEKENRPKKQLKNISGEIQTEILGGEKPEFGNENHLAVVRCVGVASAPAIRFVKNVSSGEFPDQKSAALAAGFSEGIAKNPKRIWEMVEKIDADSLTSALRFLGIEPTTKFAEIIADLASRREVVEETRLDENGERIWVRREQHQAASAAMAANLFGNFRKMAAENPPETKRRSSVPVRENAKKTFEKFFAAA